MIKYQKLKCDNTDYSIEKFKKYVKKHDCPMLLLDLSSFNILDAVKFVLLSSAYHYQKYPFGKLQYKVVSDDIKSLVSNLSIANLEFIKN